MTDFESKVASLSADIGASLKDYREMKGISQKELSTRSGVAQKTISRIENGLDNWTLLTMLKICVELDAKICLIDTNIIFGGEENGENS